MSLIDHSFLFQAQRKKPHPSLTSIQAIIPIVPYLRSITLTSNRLMSTTRTMEHWGQRLNFPTRCLLLHQCLSQHPHMLELILLLIRFTVKPSIMQVMWKRSYLILREAPLDNKWFLILLLLKEDLQAGLRDVIVEGESDLRLLEQWVHPLLRKKWCSIEWHRRIRAKSNI